MRKVTPKPHSSGEHSSASMQTSQRLWARKPSAAGAPAPSGEEKLSAVAAERVREQVPASPPATPTPSSVSGGGQPLPSALREDMGARLGFDFSKIRIYNDPATQDAALAARALAFTQGGRIGFGPLQYAPHTERGRRLVAHELVHVAQQGSPHLPSGTASQTEAEAHAFANGLSTQATAPTRYSASQAPAYFGISDLSNGELAQELHNARQWLLDHPDDPQAQRYHQYVAELEAELSKPGREAALNQSAKTLADAGQAKQERRQQQPMIERRAAPMPTVAAGDKQSLLSLIQSVRASDTASGLYTATYQGTTHTITQAQHDEFFKKVAAQLQDGLTRIKIQADYVESRYQSQQEINRKYWLSAAVVQMFGNIKDPGPQLQGALGKARAQLGAAQAAIGGGNYEAAAMALADSEAAERQAHAMWATYFEDITNAGELTIKTLEITRDVSAGVVALLAIVATGGAALGLVAEATATTAGTVALAAPVATEVATSVAKWSEGEEVDWVEVGLHALTAAVLARLGGPASGGLYKVVLGQGVSVSSKVFAGVLSGVLVGRGSVAIDAAIKGVYARIKAAGKKKTWDSLWQEIWEQLSDPEGLFIDILLGTLQGVGHHRREAAAGGAGNTQEHEAPPVRASSNEPPGAPSNVPKPPSAPVASPPVPEAAAAAVPPKPAPPPRPSHEPVPQPIQEPVPQQPIQDPVPPQPIKEPTPSEDLKKPRLDEASEAARVRQAQEEIAQKQQQHEDAATQKQDDGQEQQEPAHQEVTADANGGQTVQQNGPAGGSRKAGSKEGESESGGSKQPVPQEEPGAEAKDTSESVKATVELHPTVKSARARLNSMKENAYNLLARANKLPNSDPRKREYIEKMKRLRTDLNELEQVMGNSGPEEIEALVIPEMDTFSHELNALEGQLPAQPEFPEGAQTKLSQPGGLMATEGTRIPNQDGTPGKPSHPYKEHGPKTDPNWLRNMIREEGHDAATRFSDPAGVEAGRAKMETAIGESMDANQEKINTWLQSNPPAGARLSIRHDPGLGNLGDGFYKTPTGDIEPIPPGMVLDVVVVGLKSDGKGSYVIQTAYPVSSQW